MTSADHHEMHRNPLAYFKKSNERYHHVSDLKTTPQFKGTQTGIPNVFPQFTYVVYVQRAVRNLVLTLFFDWTMPFVHPFNFFLICTVFPLIVFGLIIVELTLHIMFAFGFGKVMNSVATRWGGGLTPVNWWDPRIFSDEVSVIVRDGLVGLDQPLPSQMTAKDVENSQAGKQTRSFNIDIAETLLFMSAIVYERDDAIVREAHKTLLKCGRHLEEGTPEKFEEVNLKLRSSESRIHEQAEKWGLKFTSLSELNSLGGPFAGMFWDHEHNFIAVVFKGTTPTNFEDFLVDAMIQRVDSRSYVFGEIHEGFYTSLFPEPYGAAARATRTSPYTTVVEAIRQKATEIKNAHRQNDPNYQSPVNIYVTGHSLGAALGTLFYTRLLKCPQDLGPDCVLRDGYLFGTPAIGDADFAAAFAEISNEPFDRPNTLWRVIDDTDIITKLPPGYDDPGMRRFISKFNVLNYMHVGEGIRFFQDGRPPVASVNIFGTDKEPLIMEHTPEHRWNPISLVQRSMNRFERTRANGTPWHSRKDVFKEQPIYQHEKGSPLIYLEMFLPTFFRNHMPHRYFEAMQRARKYFEPDDDDDQDDGQIVIHQK